MSGLLDMGIPCVTGDRDDRWTSPLGHRSRHRFGVAAAQVVRKRSLTIHSLEENFQRFAGVNPRKINSELISVVQCMLMLLDVVS